MPRTRKPQSGVARPAGRVASTTTGATKNVPSPVVYRIPVGGNNKGCSDLKVTIYGTRPVHVKEHNVGEFEVYINEAELRGIIERYEHLDLSHVELTLGDINGPVTITGNLNVEDGTFSADEASVVLLNADRGNIEDFTADEATIASATIEEAEITNATIEEETVTNSTIEDATISSAEIEEASIANATIEEETVEASTITDANIETESVGTSTIETANINEGNVVTANIETANIEEANIEDSTVEREEVTESFLVGNEASATFRGTNTFESDAAFNEDINVGGDANLHNVNVDNVATFEGQLNAKGNAAFDKNVSVAGNSTFNTVNTNGYATFNDRTTFNENATFNDTLTAQNNATFNGHTSFNTISASGQATFKDDADFEKNINVNGNAVIEGNERIDGSLSVARESEFKSHLNVGGKLTASNEEVLGKITTTAIEVSNRAVFANEETENAKIKNLEVTESFKLPDGALDQFQAKSEKDQPNGYAGLDSNGKISIDELPDEVANGMHYRGAREPTSDYPANPKLGDFYKVTSVGTKEGIDFAPGDTIVYNGNSWDYIPSADDVVSVNGRKGVVDGLEETSNKVTVMDKNNPSQVKYPSEYAVVNVIGDLESRFADDEASIAALNNALETKADKSNTYTKQEVDDILDDAVEHSQALSDLSDLVNTKASKEYVDGQLNLKANVSDVYDKDVMDHLLADKAHITHKHAISDVTGLQEKLAVYDTWEGRLEDAENDIDDLQKDIGRIDEALRHKADLDANGKLAQTQIPDNVVTTDKLQAAIELYVTKTLIESKIGVAFNKFVIPVSGTAATLANDWITEQSVVLWNWTDDLSGHITWSVTNGRVIVNSTENENGTFTVILMKPTN